MSADVPSSLKPKLEQVFGDIILEEGIGPKRSSVVYNLNHLKDCRFQLDTDTFDRGTLTDEVEEHVKTVRNYVFETRARTVCRNCRRNP